MEDPAPADAAPAELLAAARDVIAAAAASGVTLRLLGGIAVFHLARSARLGPLTRGYHDFDVVVPSKQGGPAARIFRAAGYGEDPHFNALHGARRLIFQAPAGFVVDVVVGEFQMCHRLSMDLPATGLTVDPADLLLTKLQVVQIAEKDLIDATALLLDVEIDPARFAAPLAADWGFHHTVERNLLQVAGYANERLPGVMGEAVASAAGRLGEAMATAPKSLRWKARARLGERMPWYELPEEV